MSSINTIKNYVNSLLVVPESSLFPTNNSPIPLPATDEVSGFFAELYSKKQDLQIAVNKLAGNAPKIATKDLGYEKYLEYPNPRLAKVAQSIVDPGDTDTEKMYKIEQWALANFEYKTDELNYGEAEHWATPTEMLNKGSGDCVANYEEIWTESGLKQVGALEVGDVVLSYDFDKKDYCYKPITKIWEKGVLPVFRVSFTNGTWIDVTEDHKLPLRNSQKKGRGYIETKVKDIDLSRWWKRKIPCVKELPYWIDDIEWLTEEHCFVIGHFLAEGDCDGSHVRTSGYDVPHIIVPILDKYSIPYSITTNNSGVPYLNFLDSEFKYYLKKCKTNSFDIHIPEELFYLPQNKLHAIIDGHFLGDGHYSKYADNSNKEKTYSTSSFQLAYDLQRLHLQLGIPIHMWLQVDHKGVGDKPIWRLSLNTNSYFSRDYGYEGISEVSIKSIEPIGETEVRDFEVKDTHIFITKTGALVFNCEDFGFLITSLGLHAGVDSSRLRMYGGYVKAGEGAQYGGHGWAVFKRDDGEWVPLDGSYYTTDQPIDERTPLRNNPNYVEDFWYVTKDGTVDATYKNYIRNPEMGAMYSPEDSKGWSINIYS